MPLKADPNDQRLQAIAYVGTTLQPGQVSGPIPLQDSDTALVIHLDARAKADPAGLADFESRFRQSRDQQLQMMVYHDWANWQNQQPGTHKSAQPLDAYGTVSSL